MTEWFNSPLRSPLKVTALKNSTGTLFFSVWNIMKVSYDRIFIFVWTFLLQRDFREEMRLKKEFSDINEYVICTSTGCQITWTRKKCHIHYIITFTYVYFILLSHTMLKWNKVRQAHLWWCLRWQDELCVILSHALL